MEPEPLGLRLLGRMERAVNKVRERLLRATAALDKAGVPYAIAGGNAVGNWVARVDDSLVRLTQDVDILLRRQDLPAAKVAMEAAGFIYRHAASIDMFLDGAGAKARDAVHVVFAGEKVRPDYVAPAPEVSESERTDPYQVLSLDALVRMKLTSYRDKDRTHLRDLMDAGLVDAAWLNRLSAPLAERLQALLDTPDG